MNDVETYRVTGTAKDVKKYLAQLVRSAKDGDPDGFEYGDTKASDVKASWRDKNSLYANATFSTYHIDYTATPEKRVNRSITQIYRELRQLPLILQ